MSEQRKLSVKVPDPLLAGVHANHTIVRHTREEFLIDFVNRFPPGAVVTARLIVSPGHLKRMIGALAENLSRYERAHPAPASARRVTGETGTVPPSGGEGSAEVSAGSGAAGEGPSGGEAAPAQAARLPTKVPDIVLAGAYANQMVVSHSPDEFLLDFMNIFPPEGVVTARVFLSPGQLRRTLSALRRNLARYEATHGAVVEATVPRTDTYLN